MSVKLDLPGKPTGLGTSAAQLVDRLRAARDEVIALARPPTATPAPTPTPAPPSGDAAYAEGRWGDGTHAPLYAPVTERFNEPLADEVDLRLVAWAAECGFDADEREKFGKARFGGVAMITPPD